jgi:sugar lactone lactonase YvrE
MKKWILVALVLVVGVCWWIAAAPRPEIPIGESVVFDPSTQKSIAAVDDSAGFAAGLEQFPSNLPPFDDLVFLPGGTTALVTAVDGRIWAIDLATHAAQPFVDPPLMAYGIHEAPGDPNHVYFCASRSYRAASPGEAVGLYRLTIDDRSIQPIVLEVPATNLEHERPVVYADDDSRAPELRSGASGGARRALVVCDNLEVSEDGRRIYFTEPFDYAGASVDDAVDEAIALAPNGRLWRHDLDSGTTRLVAEGFHYINGVLYDLHPDQPREDSVLVTQTSLFRLTRFNLRGPKAGTSEVVLDGITGMDDGMDRDAAGRIWLALFTERGALLTWVHAHAWLKPLFMRLPARLLLRRQRPTGVVVVSPDGRTPLYAAMYEGPMLSSVASAVAGPDGIYLANESLSSSDREQTGLVRLKWPRQFRP